MMQRMFNQMFGNNPLFKRAQEMSRGKTPEEMKQIAMNLCQQRGIDINAAYDQFQKQMKGMFPGGNGISR